MPLPIWLASQPRHSAAWMKDSSSPAAAPAAKPSTGLPVCAATANPTQAPHSICPSMPRLTMPTRCVSVSPSVAIIRGVEERSIAATQEPATAMASISAISGTPAACHAAGAKCGDEQQPLQDRSACARDLRIKLQRIARGDQPADQDRNRDSAQKVLAGQPGDQESGQAIADGNAGLQSSLNGRGLADAGKAGERATDRHHEQR